MLNKFSTYLILIVFVISFVLIYKPYIFIYQISGGDYVSLSNIYVTYILQNSFLGWQSNFNLGQSQVALLNYAPYLFLIDYVSKILHNNDLLERVMWWIPFLFLSFYSVIRLNKLLGIKPYVLSLFIFLFNTYTLMLISGGQISGIGLALAITPLIIYYSIYFGLRININCLRCNSQNSLILTLLIAIQAVFDIRVVYIQLFALFIYLILYLFVFNPKLKFYMLCLLFLLIIPGILTILLHSFWILPTLIYHINPVHDLGAAYSSNDAVKYFSFAKFENSFSLLHPNWPENIFGKVNFMKPEFIVLPVLAYSSLLFLKKKSKKYKFYLIYFALLGMIGSFLAKGANDPFGNLYLWLFDHVPGFFMFRDSSKWYILIVISYMILIPLSVYEIYTAINIRLVKYAKFASFIFIIIILGFLLWLIRPALNQELTGTFLMHKSPVDYQALKEYLSEDLNFSRVLWVPAVSRFGYTSNVHPGVSAYEFYQTQDLNSVIKYMHNAKNRQIFQESGIRYVIVPEDTQQELFLKDRKYNNALYLQTISSLNSMPGLLEIINFGQIKLYKFEIPFEHFFALTQSSSYLNYKYISPVLYSVSLNKVKMGDRIIFSENFDQNWVAISSRSKAEIKSVPYKSRFNSFIMPYSGSYQLTVKYKPQKMINTGLVISLTTLIIIFLYLLIFNKKLNNHHESKN